MQIWIDGCHERIRRKVLIINECQAANRSRILNICVFTSRALVSYSIALAGVDLNASKFLYNPMFLTFWILPIHQLVCL